MVSSWPNLKSLDDHRIYSFRIQVSLKVNISLAPLQWYFSAPISLALGVEFSPGLQPWDPWHNVHKPGAHQAIYLERICTNAQWKYAQGCHLPLCFQHGHALLTAQIQLFAAIYRLL